MRVRHCGHRINRYGYILVEFLLVNMNAHRCLVYSATGSLFIPTQSRIVSRFNCTIYSLYELCATTPPYCLERCVLYLNIFGGLVPRAWSHFLGT